MSPEVVLDGDTVRRPPGPWTPSVHALLVHVRARGVDCVPEPSGADAVSFLQGVVPDDPMPTWVWEESILVDAARLLRRLHDATRDFDRAGRAWRSPTHTPDEVVCHNDFAPYNLVFRNGGVAGVIDFEHASPGPRVWDLAYLAYRIVPLASPDNPDALASPDDVRARRLQELCSAYGCDVSSQEVLATIPDRLIELAAITTSPDDALLYRSDAAWVRRYSR
jgi:Phosphotransferase enzyme family